MLQMKSREDVSPDRTTASPNMRSRNLTKAFLMTIMVCSVMLIMMIYATFIYGSVNTVANGTTRLHRHEDEKFDDELTVVTLSTPSSLGSAKRLAGSLHYWRPRARFVLLLVLPKYKLASTRRAIKLLNNPSVDRHEMNVNITQGSIPAMLPDVLTWPQIEIDLMTQEELVEGKANAKMTIFSKYSNRTCNRCNATPVTLFVDAMVSIDSSLNDLVKLIQTNGSFFGVENVVRTEDIAGCYPQVLGFASNSVELNNPSKWQLAQEPASFLTFAQAATVNDLNDCTSMHTLGVEVAKDTLHRNDQVFLMVGNKALTIDNTTTEIVFSDLNVQSLIRSLVTVLQGDGKNETMGGHTQIKFGANVLLKFRSSISLYEQAKNASNNNSDIPIVARRDYSIQPGETLAWFSIHPTASNTGAKEINFQTDCVLRRVSNPQHTLHVANGKVSILTEPTSSPTLFRFRPASDVYSSYISNLYSSESDEATNRHRHVERPDPSKQNVVIALLVPSLVTIQKSVAETPIVSIFLDTFARTVPSSSPYIYQLYIGHDKGDRIYDSEDGQKELQAEVAKIASKGIKMPPIRFRGYTGMKGAPAWIWNSLAHSAYEDGCDYFFQLNDDIEFRTADWAPKLIAPLESNPVHPGFGVSGPTDVGTTRILTQSFVSRIHLEVFDTFYPQTFKNWWSDDWISSVYLPSNVFKVAEVQVINTNRYGTRYTFDSRLRMFMTTEVEQGKKTIDLWKHLE